MTHVVAHGYKGFKNDLTCRGFQYKVGQTYEIDEESELAGEVPFLLEDGRRV